jgi:hypothetical protein
MRIYNLCTLTHAVFGTVKTTPCFHGCCKRRLKDYEHEDLRWTPMDYYLTGKPIAVYLSGVIL